MANDFKLLVDELKLKLNDAYKRVRTLELELQEKVSYIHKLQEELGLEYSMKQSIANKEERKTNGKSW